MYKANLRKKRIRLKTLLGNNEYEETGQPLFGDAYLSFLNTATDLEVALKVENWENADEILDTLLDIDPTFKGEKRYAIIVYQLLEGADV